MDESKLEAVAAELEIRNLVGRYVDAIHRRDPKDWGATWASDGEWRLPNPEDPSAPRTMQGRETIVAGWEAAMAGFPQVHHRVHSGVIEIADGAKTATGRWYLSETVTTADGSVLAFYGLYNDNYVLEDGAWRFGVRDFNILYMGPVELAGNFIPHPNV